MQAKTQQPVGTYVAPLRDTDPMPFGKYKGRAMVNVPGPYLYWLLKNGCDHVAVRKYILINEEAILKEISKQQYNGKRR
jgi:uncharacterized protein (DUF3820 family)